MTGWFFFKKIKMIGWFKKNDVFSVFIFLFFDVFPNYLSLQTENVDIFCLVVGI